MGAVAAGDRLAAYLVPRAGGIGVAEHRTVAVQVAQADIGNLELYLAASRQPGPDQVLDDLRLRVDRHPAPAGQVAEVDVVPFPGELQVDPAVLQALGVEPLAQAGRAEQLDGARLEQPRPLPRLAVGAAAGLHDDRLDAAQGKQVGQQEAGRAGADDADLCR